MMAICGAAALFAAGMLLYILVVIFLKGVASLNPHFILFSEINTGMGLGTGVGNAIAGTILLAVTSTIIAIPFGVGTAIYLQKYASDNLFTRFLRLMIEVLSGTPSIVLGIFGIAVLVIYLKPITGGESLMAGALALGVLIIPVIERSTEDALARVPCELEEGSYALGATKWLTIRNIIIPYALSGIIVGAILGFGRAAEESAVVLLTAGYSQYMPQFRIAFNPNFLLGIKIYPLNDLVGSLPVFLYTSYENSNVFPVSSIFAAGFVLIIIVLFINLSARAILFYATAKAQGHQDSGLFSFCGLVSGRFRRKKPEAMASCFDVVTAPSASVDLISRPEETRISGTQADPAPDRQNVDVLPVVLPVAEPPKRPRPGKKILSAGAGIALFFHSLRQRIRTPVHVTSIKKTQASTAPGSADHGAVRKPQSSSPGRLRGFVRPFLIRLAPFALVAAILLVLTLVMPGLSPGGSNGPAGLVTVALIALVLCAIGTLGSLFLLRLAKIRTRNRRARLAAIALGICCIFVASCIFTGHLFSPATPSTDSDSSAAPGLLGFLHFPGSAAANTTDSSDKSARLAAFLASEGGGDTGSSSVAAAATPPESTVTPASVPAAPSATSAVPVKNALDIGESYWYGDDSRPCLATVYNVTTLPFYFWWDMDWNRFVQQTPASTGDTFLVIFIRIEDTGRTGAIVPSADEFIVTNNGQTYTHTIYFDTSVLTQDEINYYTANYNALPYQWIREIGQQKRDYAFLTGYNVFGQNWTTTDNETTVYQPGFDTNGQGYFIRPGSSNAIDGYLIYEVPDAVAADLRDTYVQVSFNSFSPTRWRLGK